VYAGGSFAFGGYDPGRSDLDVAAVSRGMLEEAAKHEVGRELRHESLPCPARGLELVVYSDTTAKTATGEPGYELDLNTGPEMPFGLSVDPVEAPGRHWYVIDRAIVREHGLVLHGPPARDLVAPIPRETLLAALADSIRWHETSTDVRGDDTVLNACRAWRYAAEGEWSSKPDAGAWARARADDTGLIADAIAARSDGRRLDRERVDAFLRGIRGVVESSL
jgi:hypothetical protein